MFIERNENTGHVNEKKNCALCQNMLGSPEMLLWWTISK